ncbi:MAG: AAA family ATPase [Peptococcaceae bacterium]|nr:AAA family ATPase [Peptococcaceae bacterium]
MGIYINPKNIAFIESLNSKIYVDKTGLLEYTNSVLSTEQKYLCISRPRRFGKSIAAKMLAAYYCKDYNSEDIFANLKIAQDISFKKHLNKYDIIFINMQDFLSDVKDIQDYPQHIQKELLEDIKEVYGEFLKSDVDNLIKALKIIHDKTERGFVFIIDEWDAIFRTSSVNNDIQTEYLDFLRLLLKDKSYVKLAYMTGILPIKKYGTQSTLNMFSEFSMTEPKLMAEYIGFTEEEVVDLCNEFKMDLSMTKHWYNGYVVKNGINIYNPKSVVDAMLNQEYHSYWAKTETYESLKMYIDLNFNGLKDDIIKMLSGGTIKVNSGSFSNDMTTFKTKDDVLTLLIHLGYLSYNTDTFLTAIPNEEIRAEFLNAMLNSHNIASSTE